MLVQAVMDAGFDVGNNVSFDLRNSNRENFGDYSSNVALLISLRDGGKAVEIAQKIVAHIQKQKNALISQVSVADPGFINMGLSITELVSRVQNLPHKYGRTETFSGQRVMVEFTDPNPYKEFHLGHLVPNIVGSVLANLYEWGGATVARVNYQGDVGLHVAKSVWGLKTYLKTASVSMAQLAKEDIEERVRILGLSYAQGAYAYETDEVAKQEIIEINKTIYDASNEVTMDMYRQGREWSLSYFETIYERLGTHFDEYFFESEAGGKGLQLVREHLSDGVFVESEGAIIYPGEKFGLHNRVFINGAGLPTYEAKELALARIKYERWAYDRSLIVAGSEINDYFNVLLHAMARVFPDLAEKTTHVGHGMLTLKGKKMSSRTGDIVRATDVIDLVRAEVFRLSADATKSRVAKTGKKEHELIAIGSLRYAILRKTIGRDIVFDLSTALSFEGDSGPYLQYTYARATHVIEKSQGLENKPSHDELTHVELTASEQALVKVILRFSDVVTEAQETLSPHLIVQYATELSQHFNAFYQECRVIEEDKVYALRLDFTKAVQLTLGNALEILGIARLSSM